MNETPTPKRLLRSPDDRVIAGVAGGLGRYFGIDPIIFRIGLGALSFVGGVGIVAYLAAALFVPEDDGSGNPKPFEWTGRRKALAIGAAVVAIIALSSGPLWFFWALAPDDGWGWVAGSVVVAVLLVGAGLARLFARDRARAPLTARRVLLLAAIAIGVLTLSALLATGSAWVTAEGGGAYVAAAVVILGMAMVAMAFAGGAAWLALPALALALPAGAVAASGFELEGGYGERTWRPLSFQSVPADGYTHAVGQAVVDLRELRWERGSSLDLEADLGIGQLRVLVPQQVCVQVDSHADAGAIYFRGDESGGVDYRVRETPPAGSAPVLRLDADVAMGVVVIADEDTDVEDWHDHDNDAARERAQNACEAGSERR